jgi:hypothetical protein
MLPFLRLSNTLASKIYARLLLVAHPFYSILSMAIGTTCNAPEFTVSFKRRVLTSGAEARGVAWQIGNPDSQTLPLLPSALVSIPRNQ